MAVYDEEQEKNIKQNGGEIKTDSVMDSFSFCLLGSFVDFSLLDNPADYFRQKFRQALGGNCKLLSRSCFT